MVSLHVLKEPFTLGYNFYVVKKVFRLATLVMPDCVVVVNIDNHVSYL